LPYYDQVVIDPARWTDPEVVLEGYTAIWHYDRETHLVTVSDEISGEDGTIGFDGTSVDGKVLYDGLGLTLTSGPLSRVDVTAEYNWTQVARGDVDLTDYVTSGMGGDNGIIVSYTFTADDWPKTGTSLGDGWEASQASATELYDTTPKTTSASNEITVIWADGARTNVKTSYTQTVTPPGQIPPGSMVSVWGAITDDIKTTYATDGEGKSYPASFSRNTSYESEAVFTHHVKANLDAGYKAERPCTERVTFSLFADVQHILTDPEDGEALRLADIRSVNLSEPLGGETGAEVPIGDPRRRSYIATPRGVQSFEHLIALARAHLMRRARVVEIAFAPKLSRMPEITLRKNVLLNEPRIGEALGKVIGYSIALDGADGRISCSVRIGCAIGRGGSVVAVDGTPTYCSIEYTGADYQQFVGRTVLFDDDNDSVGYEPPNAAPNDDGIEFLSPRIAAEDVIEEDITLENPVAVQLARVEDVLGEWDQPFGVPDEETGDLSAARSNAINNTLKSTPMRAVFKLKSMNRAFSTDYDLQVTTLQIPIGYDLEAV
jgi:hypothetical protein